MQQTALVVIRSYLKVFKSFYRHDLARYSLTWIMIGLVLQGGILCGWAKKKPIDHFERSFLPPVATINPVLDPAALKADHNELDLTPVSLAPTSPPPELHTTPRVKQLDTALNLRESDGDYEKLLKIQQKLSEEDLKALWEATVEKNPVIRFSLEKLAMPAEVQEEHSSQFVKKSLNLLISGAAMATTLLPGAGGLGSNYYRNIGAMAGRDALANVVNGPVQIPENMLSPTEKIQLAGLIDELQATVIQTYHNYRNTLQSLTEAHKTAVHNNTIYANALKSTSPAAQLAAGAAYYASLLHENDLRQKAKQYRLQLERLAGVETVSSLRLSVAFTEDLLATSGATEKTPSTTGTPHE